MNTVIVSIPIPEIRDSMEPNERKRAIELENALDGIQQRASGMLLIARGVYAMPLHNNLPLLLEISALAEMAGFGYQMFSCDSPIVRQVPTDQKDATAAAS